MSVRTEQPPAGFSPLDALIALARGMWVTFKHLLPGSRRKFTVQYPFQKRTVAARYHGRHILNFHPDGLEKCIGCELCAGACPADAILVIGEENPAGKPVAPGERYGAVYQINMLRCIFCGLCVEACPTEAITMTTFYEMASESRDQMIYTKTELQQRPPAVEGEKFALRPRAS